MDATHTQPWFILADPDARGNWRVSSADGVVATVGLMPDAARIVAVINAMSGIEDPVEFVAEANRLIAEEADLLAMPDAEVVPQETVDRILGITDLRASHERLRAALKDLIPRFVSCAIHSGKNAPEIAESAVAMHREALASMPPA